MLLINSIDAKTINGIEPNENIIETIIAKIIFFLFDCLSFKEKSKFFSASVLNSFSLLISFPDSNSLTLIHKMLHNSTINELDGKHLPHSHLETLLKPMSNYSANCSCVNPFSFLFCFIKTPICFKFIIMSSSKIIIVFKANTTT